MQRVNIVNVIVNVIVFLFSLFYHFGNLLVCLCYRPFWGFVNELTPDDQEAAIMAPLVNSFGSIGGMIGPVMVGAIHEHLGSYRPALLFFAWTELMAALPLFYCLSQPKRNGYTKVGTHAGTFSH